MIYKTIPITERADGSLQIDSRNINLRQGDYNFKLQYSTYKDYSNYSPIVNVQVAFRRKDGQQTGWLPMTHIREKEYSINLKNTWFTKEAGILYMTFRVFQTSDTNVQLIINTASASLPIIPIAQFNPEEEDLMPSEFEVYMSQTNEAIEDLRNDLSLNQLGKGIFDNEQELLATYPNGADYPEGTWAVLLSTNTVWLYNSTTKTWYNSGRDVTDIFDLDDNVYRFAKQLYEESVNELDMSNINYGYTLNDGDGTLLSNANYNVTDYIEVDSNTDYVLSFYANYGDGETTARISEYQGNLSFVRSISLKRTGIGEREKKFKTNSSTKYIRIQYRTTDTNLMLNKGDVALSYHPYNQNRHITNSEAEYLKDEFEKQENLLDVKTSSLTKNGITVSYNETTNIWTYSGTTTSTSFYIALPINVNLDATKRYTLFRDRTLNNDIATQITKTNVSNNGAIEANKTSVKLTNLNVGIPDAIMVYVNSIEVGTTISGEFKLSLIEGENFSGEFNSYNSASHITNPQADLLKSEWEKGANIIGLTPIASTEYRGITYTVTENEVTFTGTNTDNVNLFVELVEPIKAGTNITSLITSEFIKGTFSGGHVEVRLAKGKSVYTDSILATNKINYVTQHDYTHLIFQLVGITTITGTLYIKPMLVTSSEQPSTFYPYNGAIIHKKDIEPVLLWENSSINNDLLASNVTTLNRSQYKYITYEQKSFSSAEPQFITVENDSRNLSTYLTFYQIINGTTYARSRNIEWQGATALKISDCYSAGSTDATNSYCKLYRIFGRNYL